MYKNNHPKNEDHVNAYLMAFILIMILILASFNTTLHF